MIITHAQAVYAGCGVRLRMVAARTSREAERDVAVAGHAGNGQEGRRTRAVHYWATALGPDATRDPGLRIGVHSGVFFFRPDY